MNPDLVSSLTYRGADGQEIVRPPGLSDLPGGAAVAAMLTMTLGVVMAFRQHTSLVGACGLPDAGGRRHDGAAPDPGAIAGPGRGGQRGGVRAAAPASGAGGGGRGQPRLRCRAGRGRLRLGGGGRRGLAGRAVHGPAGRRRRQHVQGRARRVPDLHIVGAAVRVSLRCRDRALGDDAGLLRRQLHVGSTAHPRRDPADRLAAGWRPAAVDHDGGGARGRCASELPGGGARRPDRCRSQARRSCACRSRCWPSA